MLNNTKLAVLVLVAGMLSVSPLHAQFFAPAQTDSNALSQNGMPSDNQAASNVQQQNAPEDTSRVSTWGKEAAAQQNNVSPFDYSTAKFKSQVEQAAPTARSIYFSPEDDKRDQELIMMYMKDFRVYRSPSGQTRCSAQFALVTTLPAKLSNISYRLQWPNMDTVLTFSNVMPEVENHYNYSLLGDGCYSMDRSPNIIINRCRVKGLSQQACASKVRWINRAQ